MIKIPKTRFKAVLCAKKEVIPVAEYTKKSNLYSERDEIVKNGDISLSGILSVPNNGGGPYPAVLLVWDSGPMDNTNMGVFTDIAHALAENGYGVLRLDKRGIGKSQGFFLTYAQAEEIDDLAKSVDLLKTMPEVDKSRIAVLGYGEGGFYAAHLAGMDEEVKGCVIISASARMNSIKNDFGKIKESIASSVSNDPEYLKFVMMTMDESKSLIKDKDDWITLLGSRIFTKAMKMQDNYDILEALVKVKVPVLILHGKKASANFTDEAKEMEAALSKSGNNNFRVVYFKGLDSCMGTVVKNNTVRDHIEVDPDVIKTIISWLDENLTAPASFSRENSPPLQASE